MKLFDKFIDRLRIAAARMKHEEGGAIVVLSFVAVMILFMVTLIIYDTGQLTRDKIDAQMAADTAAYSQASVKARGMNMLALGNVGKRTTVGIRNMYFGQMPAYTGWVASRCSRCCCGWFCGCWGACLDCAANMSTLVPILGSLDYLFFTIGRITGDKFTTQLSAIDAYQRKLAEYTPYWAAAEGVLRGVGNGAGFVGTFPMPNNSQYGSLPVNREEAGFFSGVAMESCLTPTGFFNPITVGSTLEWQQNFAVLRRNSKSRPWGRQGPRERANIAISYAGCASLGAFPFLDLDMEFAPPYFLAAQGDGGNALMQRSNMTFTYLVNEDYEEKLRENYQGIIEQDYRNKPFWRPQGGVWSMARGEIYYVEGAQKFGGVSQSGNGKFVLVDGPNTFAMHHPAWIGKLRPMAVNGEDIPVDMDEIWKEADETFVTQSILFGGGGSKVFMDRLYMNRVMKGLTGKIDNKEVLDGIGK